MYTRNARCESAALIYRPQQFRLLMCHFWHALKNPYRHLTIHCDFSLRLYPLIVQGCLHAAEEDHVNHI